MASRPIPILMYHRVGSPVQDKHGTFLNVTLRDFERQMRLLKRFGYQSVTFKETVSGLFKGAPLPAKPVCVTFDDGYATVVENAAPALDKLGWKGVVFVPTAYVGDSNKWDIANGHDLHPIMDWPALGSLATRGWELAAHSRIHPRLAEMTESEAFREMLDGADDLERRTGIRPSTFCYPYGSVNGNLAAIARKVGFIGACTTKSGLARSDGDPYLLPRVKVAYRDGIIGMLYRLWLRPRLGSLRN